MPRAVSLAGVTLLLFGEGGDAGRCSGAGGRLTPSSPLVQKEFSLNRKGGLARGQGNSRRAISLGPTQTAEQLASAKGGQPRLDPAD